MESTNAPEIPVNREDSLKFKLDAVEASPQRSSTTPFGKIVPNEETHSFPVIMKKISLSFLILIMASVSIFAETETITVQKWKPIDLTFETNARSWRYCPTNPFEIDFYAEVTGPGNISFILPGFYNGDYTWKIRFSPTKEGIWNITTHSEVVDLDNLQTRLECVKNDNDNVHGGLRIEPKNPHHFIYEDGSRWFPMGYEANWLFAMDMDKEDANLPTLNPFLDKIGKHGFNFILLNAYSYDTSWRNGKTSEYDLGPPLMFPWGGSYEEPNFSEFNLEYWEHIDKVIEAMYQRGITAHIYFKVYNKLVNWPKNGSMEDDMYYRWVIARYAAYPNIIWDLAKEAHYEKSYRYKVDRLEFIRSTDPYDRLITVHDDRVTYNTGHYDELVDFRSSQEHNDTHATVLGQLASGGWPVLNVESGYEHGPEGLDDKTYGRSNTPEEVVTSIWKIQMAGVYNAYYYTYGAWDVIRPDDTPPGYAYVKKFTDFFAGTQYWLLKSDDSLVSAGYCLSNPGKEYVVFQEEAKTFELNLSGLRKPIQATWFQPFTGEVLDAGTLKKGKVELTPPASLGKGPVVLHLKNS